MFMVHPHVIDGQTLFLVQPVPFKSLWTQDNKHLRSSVWDSNGNLVSAGFPKFTNWGENPEHFPVPTSLNNTHIVEKIDGSLFIVSRWNGRFIYRTRGTVNAAKLDNGHEVEIFKQKYQSALDKIFEDSSPHSLLFEWVSPEQRIILDYGDQPEWYLIGCVYHEDYSLMEQFRLDELAHQYEFKRPPSYIFPSIKDLMGNVEQWKNKEGVVIYSNNGQMPHKVKAFEYLTKHRFKSEATLENTLELYLKSNKPSYQEFKQQLIEAFDYECFEMVRGFASDICDGAKEVQHIVENMEAFVKTELSRYPTRKLQAAVTFQSYGKTNRSSFVFKILDGKSLTIDDYRKLFWQVLKK